MWTIDTEGNIEIPSSDTLDLLITEIKINSVVMDSTGVNGYATQNDLSSIPSLSDGDKGDISVSGK